MGPVEIGDGVLYHLIPKRPGDRDGQQRDVREVHRPGRPADNGVSVFEKQKPVRSRGTDEFHLVRVHGGVDIIEEAFGDDLPFFVNTRPEDSARRRVKIGVGRIGLCRKADSMTRRREGDLLHASARSFVDPRKDGARGIFGEHEYRTVRAQIQVPAALEAHGEQSGEVRTDCHDLGERA